MANALGLCELCCYYKPYHPVGGQESRTGQCRRHPPIPVFNPDKFSDKHRTVFPTVDKTDWCGEWNAR